MPLPSQSTTKTALVLSLAQAQSLFEQETRRLADMSAEQFLMNWYASEYPDLDDTPDGHRIAYHALLIPFGRQKF